MDFSASFDTMAILFTAGGIIVILISVYWYARSRKAVKSNLVAWLRAGISVFLLFTLVYCYLFHPQKYYIKKGDLVIKRPWNDVHIKINDILDCRTLTETDMTGTIRTFGVGGLFGYFGSYHNPMIGNMTFYTTQRKNLVLIHASEGRSIILSPDKPKDFADEIITEITPIIKA